MLPATASLVGTISAAAAPAAKQVLLHGAVAALALRGGVGAEAGALLDLNRVRIRLEGLSSYSVVSALMMNAGMRLYSGTNKQLQKGKRLENGFKVFFSLSVALSILTGAYTTVVFSLLGLYAKTALGLGWDGPFLEFFQQTESIRKFAFDTFVVSLVTFEFSFISSLFLAHEGKMKWVVAGGASLCALLSIWHWTVIMKLASRILFAT